MVIDTFIDLAKISSRNNDKNASLEFKNIYECSL